MLSKPAAVEKLHRQVNQIDEVVRHPRFSPEFKKWQRDTEVAITNIFGEDTRHLKDFQDVSYTLRAFFGGTPDYEFDQAFRGGLDDAKALLQSLIAEVEEYWSDASDASQRPDALARLERIADRFHLVARRLRARHDSRSGMEVEDEYDVQDLLHSLLMIDFDDIRRE